MIKGSLEHLRRVPGRREVSVELVRTGARQHDRGVQPSILRETRMNVREVVRSWLTTNKMKGPLVLDVEIAQRPAGVGVA